MPKMILTDEEAAIIRERRIKEAPIIAFNDGLDSAIEIFTRIVSPKLTQFNDDADKLINDFYAAVGDAKRSMT